MKITDYFDNEPQRRRWLDKLKLWGWPVTRVYEEDGSYRVDREEPKVARDMATAGMHVDYVDTSLSAPSPSQPAEAGESEVTGPGQVTTRFTDPRSRDRFVLEQQLSGWRLIGTSEDKADGAAQRQGIAVYFKAVMKQVRGTIPR